MATRYEVVIRARNGTAQILLTDEDFLGLNYAKRVNWPGSQSLLVNGDLDFIDDLEYDGIVEVYRYNQALAMTKYCDYRGLYVDAVLSDTAKDEPRFELRSVGGIDYLAREPVMYPANTANRTAFTSVPVETIMKTLVTRNATAAGTVLDGRDYAVPAWGANITVQTDGAAGGSIDYYCARKPLLTCLQELAALAGADFDLVYTGTPGSPSWQFRYYAGQLGTDRSATVKFSRDQGTMRQPTLRLNRMNEVTRVTVGGEGVEASRDIATRTSAAYQATYHSRAIFLNQAMTGISTAGLQAAGDRRLQELKARVDLNFQAVQTSQQLYGLHYFLGDRVATAYRGYNADKKLVEVRANVAPGNSQIETIEFQMDEV